MKVALVTALGLAAAPARADTLAGSWSSPFGPLSVAQKGDEITATGKPKCAPPSSGHLLEGDLLEDSLSGQVYLCLTGCDKGPSWVPVLLLVGGDGKTLSGTSTLPKGCTANVGPHGSLVLKKQAAGAVPALPEPPPVQVPPPTTSPQASGDVDAPDTAPKPKKPKGKRPPPAVSEAPAKPHEPSREDPDARQRAIEIARDGAAFQQEGKFEQARKRFQEAIAVDPYYAEGFNGVGVTFFARNDLNEALRWYKKALVADPSFGDAYYNMACVYALQKRKPLALRYLKTAFHNGYTSRDTMRDDQDLASLHGDATFEALLGEAQ